MSATWLQAKKPGRWHTISVFASPSSCRATNHRSEALRSTWSASLRLAHPAPVPAAPDASHLSLGEGRLSGGPAPTPAPSPASSTLCSRATEKQSNPPHQNPSACPIRPPMVEGGCTVASSQPESSARCCPCLRSCVQRIAMPAGQVLDGDV